MLKTGKELQTILFIDGHCIMCSALVDFVLKRTPEHFKFTHLDSSFAMAHHPPEKNKTSSVIFYLNGQYFKKSTAVIKVLKQMPLPYRMLAYMIQIIPLMLRDVLYDLVARFRYYLFGKKQLCVIRIEEQKKSRFLP